MASNKLKKLNVLNSELKSNNEHEIALDRKEATMEIEDASDQKTISETLGYEIATDKSFETLRDTVSESTMKAIEEIGFTTMTEIQAKCIPKLLEGKDLQGTAKTGSGKTLAFLIPVVEFIAKNNTVKGTKVIIVSPTRELSMQTFGILKDLMKYHRGTYGLIMGGTNRKTEADTLAKGVDIIVATPGRLLDHLRSTSRFEYKTLKQLVIDEADRICEVGFEEHMLQIVRILPKSRQTILFSATKGDKTNNLVKAALKSKLLDVDVDFDKSQATTEGLQQSYVVCPMEKRFLVLYTFIKKNREKKVMVFFSTCLAVKFYHELLNFVDIPVRAIHGRQKQNKRTNTFFEFSQAESGVLLCTDVAARGWDIPEVDWIVQYDPPDDPTEYIHRVGRTARAGRSGQALLFLTTEEIGFTQYLRANRVQIEPIEVCWKKVANIQAQLQKLVSTNYFLQTSAKNAFSAYIKAYNSHSLKDIYNIQNLDLIRVGKCFGFQVPPFVNVGQISLKSRHKKSFGFSGSSKKQNKQRNFKNIKRLN